MLKRTLALFAMLVLASPARSADADWVGRRVVPRTADVKLGAKGGPRNQALNGYLFVVRAEEGGQLRLKSRLDDAWGTKSDWILVEEAEAFFSERIKADPKDAYAFALRGLIKELAWDRVRSVLDYKESIRLKPAAYTYFLRGSLLSTMNNPAKAKQDIDEAIRLDSTRPIFHVVRTDLLARTDPELAAKELDAVIKKLPKNADLLDSRAWLEVGAGRQAEAIKFFDAAIAADKTFTWPHFGKAQVLAGMGEDARALAEFDSALKLDPACYESRRTRAGYWLSKGEYAKAEADLTEAIRLNTTFADLRMERAAVRSASVHFDKAVEDYSEVIRMIPLHVDAFVNRGMAYVDSKKHDLAMADLNTAVKLDPKNAMALAQRGYVHTLKKRPAEAAKDFEAALKIDPDQEIALIEFAWLLSTCTDAKLRDGKRAKELIEKYRKDRDVEQFPMILQVLAAVCAENGDFANAIKHQKKALEVKWYAVLHDETGRKCLKFYEMKKPYRDGESGK